MKPYTKSTYGRDHYFGCTKEHKVPKSSDDRKGSRSAARQVKKAILNEELKAA